MTHSSVAHLPHPARLPFAVVRGVVAGSLLVLNTLFWCALLFLFALVKLVVPATPVRAAVDRVLNGIATRWIGGNSLWMRLTQRTEWDVAGLDDLAYRGWYLVNCNHQTWVDILVLQHLLNRRIPMLKFFLKQQLIYVPVIGLAWWALDFPFMRRHSDAYLKRHPDKRFDDIEATRRACEKFALVPTSVMNFAEGTRFTAAKHRSQRSPYRHLLKPKAGALALAMGVLGEKFDALLDVTIVYPDGAPRFWQFLCGDVRRVVVRVQRLTIPPEFRTGDYARDPKYRKTFQRWLQALWQDKDQRIDALLGLPVAPRPSKSAADAAPRAP
jgi:1-acyl-sn-glycerol-3-phosphate acyltransferase